MSTREALEASIAKAARAVEYAKVGCANCSGVTATGVRKAWQEDLEHAERYLAKTKEALRVFDKNMHVTQDGDRINLADLTNTHLCNILSGPKGQHAWGPEYLAEWEARGLDDWQNTCQWDACKNWAPLEKLCRHHEFEREDYPQANRWDPTPRVALPEDADAGQWLFEQGYRQVSRKWCTVNRVNPELLRDPISFLANSLDTMRPVMLEHMKRVILRELSYEVEESFQVTHAQLDALRKHNCALSTKRRNAMREKRREQENDDA